MAPRSRMRGELAATARVWVISASPPLISQRSGPLTASPKGEADAIAKKLIWRGCEPPSLPPRGKVAPQGRMRGSLTAATHSRAATASAALISQRAGPLTASPAGEAARRKKSAKTILTCTCFCGKLIVVKKAATGSRPSAHLAGLLKLRVIP